MNKISAVIIDDEFFNRKLVSMLIARLNPCFVIDGEAENIRDGFGIINSLKPDIVFLDIKMPDGSGFELLKQFGSIDFEVVFITGFDQYVLQAFDFNALDYVLKPIDMDKFKLTLEKVQARIEAKLNKGSYLKQISELYDTEEAIITKIPVHAEDKVLLLNTEDIMYVQAREGSAVFTKSISEKYTSLKQLADFEFILDNLKYYVRINQTTYVNIRYIANHAADDENSLMMHDGAILELSVAKKAEIREALGREITG